MDYEWNYVIFLSLEIFQYYMYFRLITMNDTLFLKCKHTRIHKEFKKLIIKPLVNKQKIIIPLNIQRTRLIKV